MIKNQTIIDKIEAKTTDDKIMHDFLFDIINHENENSQYSKEYTKLIEKAIEERRKTCELSLLK